MHQAPAARLALDAVLEPSPRASATARNGGGGVLLTGATGNLGRFLCAELLARTQARIHCLVRERGDGSAAGRLRAVLTGIGVPERQLERVDVVPGDLTRPALGLSPDRPAELARTLEAIYHCAADVRLGGSYTRLRAANVTGTAGVIRLALAGSPIPIHHISTLGVFLAARSHDRPGGQTAFGHTVFEHDEPDACCAGRVGYAQTKAVAEQLLRQARERGVPVTVYRLPLLIAHSTTGECTETEYLAALIRAAVRLGAAPDGGDLALPVCSVDHAAAAVVSLARTPPAGYHGGPGSNAHVLAPPPLPLADVFGRVRAAGHHVRTVPVTRWHKLVHAHRHDPAVRATRALSGAGTHLLPVTPHDACPRIDSSRTQQALRENGLHIPPVDSAFLDRMLDHLGTIGTLTKASDDDDLPVPGRIPRTDEVLRR